VTHAKLIGYVKAPDEVEAIKEAIKQFKISDPREAEAARGAEGEVGQQEGHMGGFLAVSFGTQAMEICWRDRNQQEIVIFP
jgi:hypothetical protein